MRMLTLAGNASITLSHTHFIFAHAGEGEDAAAQEDCQEPELVRARDVRVGDRLLHHDVASGRTAEEKTCASLCKHPQPRWLTVRR